MKRSEIVKAIHEVLEEMSTTGAVGGYQTPRAFAKPGQGKNVATKTAEKLGYTTVKPKKYPYSTKMIDYKKF
jgi:hypothetical protein